MTALITTLIDKEDNFEIIRDKIALIISTESLNQVALAIAASKPNPEEWKLRVFTERSNPFEEFLNSDAANPVADKSPIVNVWFDNSDADKAGSNKFERQKTEAVYNIDCYGFGVSKDDGNGGHIPGDETAARTAQRAVRLVRNILMAQKYTYLDARGLIWERWPQSITVFQPEQNNQNVKNIVGARLALRVVFNEFSPQAEFDILEFLSFTILRAEDGSILAEADFDLT